MTFAAITGLGLSDWETRLASSPVDLSAQSISRCLADADVELSDVDGLIINATQGDRVAAMDLSLARRLGFGPLRHLEVVDVKGATALAMVQHAQDVVLAGRARHVVCVFADAPIVAGAGSGSTFVASGGRGGPRGLERASGLLGSVPTFALMAARYLHLTEATEEDLRAVAISTRAWAVRNPKAVMRTPMSESDYDASPVVSTPLRIVDCARPVNGSAAVLVSDGKLDGTYPAVRLEGYAEWHAPRRRRGPAESWFGDGDALGCADAALAQARIGRDQVDVCQLSDPFSIVTLLLLEEFGFAPMGKAGALVRSGATGPGGTQPVNTGGGQLSGFYLQGMTALVEAITQLRQAGGARQIADAEHAFVGTVGGRMEHYGAGILRREAA